MEVTHYILVFVGLIQLGYSLQINSEGRTIKLKQNEDLTLNCLLGGGYKEFVEDGVTWMKYQPISDDRGDGLLLTNGARLSSQATDLGVDFSGHYHPNTEGDDPIDFTLEISNARPEESGLYKCGSNNDEVIYDVQVIDEVEEVLIYSQQQEDGGQSLPTDFDLPWTQGWVHQDLVALKTNNNPSVVACLSRGGFPAPVMKISIGNEEKNDDFNIRPTPRVVLIGDEVGNMRYSLEKIMAVRNFNLDSEQNGKTLTCEVIHQDENDNEVEKKSVTAILSLQSPPQFFDCSDTIDAPRGTMNFEIRCEFVSEPAAYLVEWKDEGHVVYRRGDPKKNGIVIQQMAVAGEPSRIAAVMRLDEVNDDALGLYELKVVNDVGEKITTFRLLYGELTNPSTGGSGYVCASVLATMISALLAFVYSS